MFTTKILTHAIAVCAVAHFLHLSLHFLLLFFHFLFRFLQKKMNCKDLLVKTNDLFSRWSRCHASFLHHFCLLLFHFISQVSHMVSSPAIFSFFTNLLTKTFFTFQSHILFFIFYFFLQPQLCLRNVFFPLKAHHFQSLKMVCFERKENIPKTKLWLQKK